jgi:2-alkyl-3-oxoalkanoate reductase
MGGGEAEGPPVRTVVSGGGGFLGRRIVDLLCARGDEVRVLTRRRHPALEAVGATCIPLDIREAAAVRTAIERADVVFHVAGKSGHWGPREAFWSVNVDGTRSVLEAVQAAGVPRLVYTSTPSVVGYARDIEHGGPGLPYAGTHESAYAESKAAAERLVLAANGCGVATVALRPHLIFGPGDDRMLAAFVRRAAQGRLRVVGDGRNRVDLTFVDNAAWAHLDAADALILPGARCAGKAYFISNDEPVVFWEWLNRLLHNLGLPPITRSLPLGVTRFTAGMLETLWRALRLDGEPPVTRFLAAALARSHWYDMEPARSDIGYRVRVPLEEGTRRTAQWLAGAGCATWRGALTANKINRLMSAAKKHQTEPSASRK